MNQYYVVFNGAVWFVKEASFFKSQGGHLESWGKNWKPIMADSVEDARTKAANQQFNPENVSLGYII